MIYFIRNTGSGHFKIGISSDPLKRLATLQTGSAELLDLVAVIPGGQAEESALHERFDDYHLRGEWFSGEPEMLDLVDQVVAESSLFRSLWEECQRRNRCRTGLNGVTLRHVPTGSKFICSGSTWGPDSILLVYPPKYRADECRIESPWSVACCPPKRILAGEAA